MKSVSEGSTRPTGPAACRGGRFAIAVVIPLYNGKPFISGAIRSVLEQTRPPDEIIVVDDGSLDGGGRLVEEFIRAGAPIRLIRQINRGQAAARNAGIAASSSSFVALLDQDDAWHPTHLAALIVPFERASGYQLGWTYTGVVEMSVDGCRRTNTKLARRVRGRKLNVLDCLRRDMHVFPSATMLSRRSFEAVGGFDEALRGYEDDDLLLRITEIGFTNAYVSGPLTMWRHHVNSASFSSDMAKSRTIYFKKLLSRYASADRCFRAAIVRRFSRREFITLARAFVRKDLNATRTSLHAIVQMAELLPFWQRATAYVLSRSFANTLRGRFDHTRTAPKSCADRGKSKS